MSKTRLCKRIKKILESQKDVEYSAIKQILEEFGYKETQSKGGGSHYVFRKIRSKPITIPKHKPVKKVYIKDVIKELALEEWYEDEC